MATHKTMYKTPVFRWPGGAKIGTLPGDTEVTVVEFVDNGSSAVIENSFFPKEDPKQKLIVATDDLVSLADPNPNPNPNPNPTPTGFPHARIWVEDDEGNLYPYIPDTTTGVKNVSDLAS